MSEPTHSYYDWQVSTLMLAYDVVEPLSRDDLEAQQQRQMAIEQELHDMAHRVLPRQYLENPQSEFPPQVVVLLTKATLQRAAMITGIVGE